MGKPCAIVQTAQEGMLIPNDIDLVDALSDRFTNETVESCGRGGVAAWLARQLGGSAFPLGVDEDSVTP